MVLDCGPGTYNQLLCLYGPEKTEDILRKLKFIFISHGHADHHAVSLYNIFQNVCFLSAKFAQRIKYTAKKKAARLPIFET